MLNQLTSKILSKMANLPIFEILSYNKDYNKNVVYLIQNYAWTYFQNSLFYKIIKNWPELLNLKILGVNKYYYLNNKKVVFDFLWYLKLLLYE